MIKNIIFDFGDVFINLDKAATARAMIPFGFKEITPKLDQLFKDYEKGVVTSLEFLTTVSSIFPGASREQLIAAWNGILLDFPDNRLVFLEDLANSKKYRLFLLSNTNEIHITHVQEKMGERFDRFKKVFDAFYLSFEMGLRKPDADIFDFVLNGHNLNANETLFVDDTLENIVTAKKLGIKTWHLQVGSEDVVALNTHL